MAAFNPSVPDMNDPNWLGWSKAIQQPEGDKSKGVLFNAVGDTLESGLKIGDKLVQKYAENEVEKQAQPIVDEQMKSMQAQSTAIKENRPLTQNDLMQYAQDDSQPKGIDTAIGRAESLTNARANGKLSETDYWGKLYSTLKDVRSHYPGYRQYIDQEMERVTGKNVANAYMTSLLGDINAAMSNTQKDQEHIATMFRQAIDKGVPNAANDFDMFRSGKMDASQALHKLNDYYAKDYQYKTIQQGAEVRKLGREEETIQAKDMADMLANKGAASYFSALSPTETQFNSVVQGVRSGQDISPDQAQAFSTQIATSKLQAERQLRKDFNDPRQGMGGRSIASIIGPEETKKRIEAQLQDFDGLSNLMTNKDYGLVHAAFNAQKAITSADQLGLLKDQTMGGFFRLQASMKDMSPELQKQMTNYFLDKNFGPQGMNTWIQGKISEFATGQPGATLTQAVKDVQKETKLSDGNKAKTSQELINWVMKIADPSTPDQAKINFIKSAYGFANLDLIEQFEKGQSQQSIFSAMTSPEVTKEIRKQSASDPSLWSGYKEWALRSVNQVFNNELRQLTGLTSTKGMVGWDSTNGQFVPSPDLQRRPQEGTLLMRTINRLNFALHNTGEIAKAEGQDPNAYALQIMQQLNAINPDTMKGLPQEFYDAVNKHREAEKNAIEQQKAAQDKLLKPRKKDQSKP